QDVPARETRVGISLVDADLDVAVSRHALVAGILRIARQSALLELGAGRVRIEGHLLALVRWDVPLDQAAISTGHEALGFAELFEALERNITVGKGGDERGMEFAARHGSPTFDPS